MNIQFSDTKVSIEFNGETSNHNLGTLSYQLTESRNGVTFRKEGFSLTTPVDEITVDGIQMTADNIDLLLSPLFVVNGNIELPLPISDVSGLQASLDSKVEKETGKGLSQEDFTTAEKEKLAALESSRFKGQYISEEDLIDNAETGEGSYAYVDSGENSEVICYIWDTDDEMWVQQLGESTAETPASVKQKYESNINTNAFTDSEKSKLANLDNTKDTDKPVSNAQQAAINAAVGNIKIGAKNLFLNTSFVTSHKWGRVGEHRLSIETTDKPVTSNSNSLSITATLGSTGPGNYIYQDYSPQLEIGKEYTLSFCIKSVSGVTSIGTQIHGGSGNKTYNITDDWQYFTYTFLYNKLGSNRFLFYLNQAGTVLLNSIQLEKGNKPTDWTPAPEDLENKLEDSMTQVQTQISGISIGGTNLITGSEEIKVNETIGSGVILQIDADMVQGETYTLSYESTSLVVANNYPQFYIWEPGNWEKVQMVGDIAAKNRTFRFDQPTGKYSLTVYNHSYPQQGTITKLKLERGSRHTDWTQSPQEQKAGIYIGGRNYVAGSYKPSVNYIKDSNPNVLKSELVNGNIEVKIIADQTANHSRIYFTETFRTGEFITLSARIKSTTALESIGWGLQSSSLEGAGSFSVSIPEANTYYDIHSTVQLTGEASHLFISSSGLPLNNKLTIADLKVERGRNFTDYCPAPEDTDMLVKNSIDNLAIGARNYVLGGKEITRAASTHQYTFHPLSLSEPLKSDTEYTLSVGKTSIVSGTSVNTFYVAVLNLSTGLAGGASFQLPVSAKRQAYTFRTGVLPNDGYTIILYTGSPGSSENRSLRWTEVQLELGNKASSWIPALEEPTVPVKTLTTDYELKLTDTDTFFVLNGDDIWLTIPNHTQVPIPVGSEMTVLKNSGNESSGGLMPASGVTIKAINGTTDSPVFDLNHMLCAKKIAANTWIWWRS